MESVHLPLHFPFDEQTEHTIEFSASTFSFFAKPVQVYHATWEDHWGERAPFVETGPDRLRLAWDGKRITHKRSLQIVIEGIANEEQSRQMAQGFLRQTLRWKE
jgi:hypothetical protein